MSADKSMSVADDNISEKEEVSASEAIIEDTGVEIAAPVLEELTKDIVPETKTLDEETGELHQELEKSLVDDKNPEDKK
jgi:hypothetical protein